MENSSLFELEDDDLTSDLSPSEIYRARFLFYTVISTAIISFCAGIVFWGLYGHVILQAITRGGVK